MMVQKHSHKTTIMSNNYFPHTVLKLKKVTATARQRNVLWKLVVVMNAQFSVEGKRSLIITAPNGKEQTILLDPTDQNKNKEILTEFFNANVDRDSDAFKKGQSKN